MFNISKYYELIKRIKRNKITIYTIYGIVGYFIGSSITSISRTLMLTKSKSIMPTMIGIIIGLFIAYQQTLSLDIKIQKMYWEIDIYNKLNKEKEC